MVHWTTQFGDSLQESMVVFGSREINAHVYLFPQVLSHW